MGFKDRDVRDSFDAMFDFNRDDTLDPFEQAMQFDFWEEGIEGTESRDKDANTFLDDDLDWDELEYMDEDERREALEDAGYDPDDFDDF